MSYQFLTVERHGGVERVTLNRPDVRNAFNEHVIAELTAWARRAHDDRVAARRRDRRRRQGVQRGRRRGVDGQDGRLLARRQRARRARRRGDVSRHQHHPRHRDRPHPRRRARRRLRPRRGVRHRGRGRGGDLRIHRDEARHPAGDDLPVRAAEDRRVGGARSVPHRHAVRRRARPRRSASCTRSCRRPISTRPSIGT